MEIKPLHILLADDDRDDCELFEAALAETLIPTNFTMSNDGIDLMNLLNRLEFPLPDLLFLDLNMPRKNGQECLWEIKQTSHLRMLPVIIFSLTVYPMMIEELYNNGALYYIQKPNSFQQLTDIIKQVLSLPDDRKWTQPSRQDFVLISDH